MSAAAWKQVALGEEAAVYGYGVLAAQLPAGPERSRAVDLTASHSRSRDRARVALADADTDPQAPTAFEIPFELDGAGPARRLAAMIETRLVDVYCRQLPDVPSEDRRYFAQQAAESGARAVSWGAKPTAFPGGRDTESQSLPSESGTAPSGPTESAGTTPSGGVASTTAPEAPSVSPTSPLPPGAGQSDGATVQ